MKEVNGVSHSPKTANNFLIKSRMTDFKLEWTWAYEAPLQSNFLLFITQSGLLTILLKKIVDTDIEFKKYRRYRYRYFFVYDVNVAITLFGESTARYRLP